MSSRQEIERLRTRAAFYRREAALAKQRPRLIFCRALAQHLESEATELERLLEARPHRLTQTVPKESGK